MLEHFAPDEFQRYADKARSDLGCVNVLIQGNAGVGKSTLLNEILGEGLAPTGIGDSVTTQITRYQSRNSPIAIYDTRGFEIKDSEATILAVKSKLIELRRSPSPADQIHIAWVCILEQSHRIEPVHASFLRVLAELQIPAIVVITQALGEEAMLKSVQELARPNSGVVPVLAQDKSIGSHRIVAHGLDSLVRKTLDSLPEAQRSAFVAAQRVRWDLKEAAVHSKIALATVLAAAGALAPVPGAHTVMLFAIQSKLIADINAIINLSISSENLMPLLKGGMGLMAAQLGGTTIFGLALSEGLKVIPGLGFIGGSVIGGSVASAITKVFGHLYFESVKKYAKDDIPLPSQEELVAQMSLTLTAHKDEFRRMAESRNA